MQLKCTMQEISLNYGYGAWGLGRQEMEDNCYFELNWKKTYRSPIKTASFQLSFSAYSLHQQVNKGFEAKKCTRLLHVALAGAVRA